VSQSLYVSPLAAGLPRTPYLTIAEFKAAPTSVDFGDLVLNGTQQQQDDALIQVIARASSEMDRFVHYVLAATKDTEQRRARVRSDGTVPVPLRGIPLLELDTFLVGTTPSTMQAIGGVSPQDTWHEDNVLFVPVVLASNLSWGIGSKVYCRYTYINGYPNTLLVAGTYMAGASSLVGVSSLGFYGGQQFTLYDSAQAGSEVLTVANSYIGGQGASTTIPLAAPLAATHVASASNPIAISALPPAVKDACIKWTSGLIKTRGGGALEMDTVEQTRPSKMDVGEGGGLEDIAMAEAMLATLVLPSYG
jgi:hypothetical protein